MSTNQGNFAGQQVNNVHANVNMPSPQVYVQWAQLSVQLSQFNVVIAIDNGTFASWNHVDQQFILSNYMMATGGVVPMFFPDGNNRVFLGPWAVLERAGYRLPTIGQYPQQIAPQGQPIAGGAQLQPLANPAQNQPLAAGAPPQVIVAGAQIPAIPAIAAGGNRRARRAAKKNADNPPRPRNAWILYRQNFHAAFSAAHPELTNNQISTFIATQWHNEPQAIKDFWHRKADEEKAEHQRKYPGYKFSPRKSSDKQRRSTSKKAATPTLHLVPAGRAPVTQDLTPFLPAGSTATFTRTGSNFEYSDPFIVTGNGIITGNGIATGSGFGDFDLRAEAKIFCQALAAEAEERRKEANEMIQQNDTLSDDIIDELFDDMEVGDAQVDDAQVDEFEFGDVFHHLEDGNYSDMDGEASLANFFKDM